MFNKMKKSGRIALSVLLLSLFIILPCWAALAGFIPNNRDTRPDPEAMPLNIPLKNQDKYVKLYENGHFVYSFKKDTMVLAVTDKRNGYTWTSGVDNITNRAIDDMNDEAQKKGEKPPHLPKEDRLNQIYTGIANSLVSLESYDESNNVKLRSIANTDKCESEIAKVSDDHYVITARHREPKITFKLHIRFTEEGLNLSIPSSEVELKEEGGNRLSAFILAPFMGATGGIKVYWDDKSQSYDKKVPNEMLPGYVLVPDGSGALIRFRRNANVIKPYVGDVFGADPAQASYYYKNASNRVEFPDPVMPVFGIAHGRDQNAFVAYAESGGEYMQVIVSPDNNMTAYCYAYPRFEVNHLYFQPYNKRGDGVFSLMEEPNRFDISMNYDFLEGDGSDGSPAANYVGMAQRYRQALIRDGVLREKGRLVNSGDIPLHLDFLMSGSKRAVVGYRDEVLTTAKQASEILRKLNEAGITKINASLMGWEKGGYTLGKPWAADFTRHIGSRGDYEALIKQMDASGGSLSFMQDYVRINESQLSLNGNAAKHVSGYYAEYNDLSLPISKMYYASPRKSLEWLRDQTGRLEGLGVREFNIRGIGQYLLSDYDSRGSEGTVSDVIKETKKAIQALAQKGTVSVETPNSYLWAETDRFRQAPVTSSQQLNETDNVPFLQMVLGNSMEVYAPYSNFSFYTQGDRLRMIDYNVYPSFVLTKESAHLLTSTNLSSYYSTEFAFYDRLIRDVYETVNGALKPVQGMTWIDRDVLAPGVIRNLYQDPSGKARKAIVINYTDAAYEADGVSVGAQNYAVIDAKGGQ